MSQTISVFRRHFLLVSSVIGFLLIGISMALSHLNELQLCAFIYFAFVSAFTFLTSFKLTIKTIVASIVLLLADIGLKLTILTEMFINLRKAKQNCVNCDHCSQMAILDISNALIFLLIATVIGIFNLTSFIRFSMFNFSCEQDLIVYEL